MNEKNALDTGFQEQRSVADIDTFPGVYSAKFFFWQRPEDASVELESRPTMTFCTNNGRLAFVDGKGDLRIAVASDRNFDALNRAGYKRASWSVPGSNAENDAFNKWYMSARTKELFLEGMERARTLPVPDIQHKGMFSSPDGAVPGEFVINEDKQTISWYCQDFPQKGGSSSGIIISPNTPDNVKKLIDAGYRMGSWSAINLQKDVHATVRAEFARWLENMPK